MYFLLKMWIFHCYVSLPVIVKAILGDKSKQLHAVLEKSKLLTFLGGCETPPPKQSSAGKNYMFGRGISRTNLPSPLLLGGGSHPLGYCKGSCKKFITGAGGFQTLELEDSENSGVFDFPDSPLFVC